MIGWGGNDDGTATTRRFLPFFSAVVDEKRYARYSLLWPFVHWGSESLDNEAAHDYFMLWPLFGWRSGAKVSGWSFLWPFFGHTEIDGRLSKTNLLWPIYRRYVDTSESTPIDQWWIWPLIGHTVTNDQRAWSLLWPLIWWREYDDPEGAQKQRWVLPFYWSVHRDRPDGTEDDFVKIWPLWHAQSRHDGTGDWSVLSPLPWREGNAYGVEEAYGWLWTLAKGHDRGPDDHAMHLAAHAFTKRQRGGRFQMSVPFLFNYQSDDSGNVLRLLQFLPIPLGGGKENAEADR